MSNSGPGAPVRPRKPIPPPGRIRVLAITFDDGWSVDTEVDDGEPVEDESKIRLYVSYGAESFQVDVPAEVIRDIGDAVARLAHL